MVNPNHQVCIHAFMTWLALAPLLGCVAGGTSGDSADVRAIRDLDSEWSHALEVKDLDKVMTFYADDAVFLGAGAAEIKGKSQIREHFGHVLAVPDCTLTFTPTSIQISKSRDLAYDISTFRLTVLDQHGNPTTRVGKALTIWERRSGQWKVALEAPSYDNEKNPSGS